MDCPWAVPGARMVCIKEDKWALIGDGEEGEGIDDVGPKSKEICTIDRVDPVPYDGEIFVFIVGYGDKYGLRGFRPLITKTEDQDIALFDHYLNTERV